MGNSRSNRKPPVEYRTYRVTLPVLRKKMPQAILKALTNARLVRPTIDVATVLQVEPETDTGFIHVPPVSPNQATVPMRIAWMRVPGIDALAASKGTE